MKILIVDDEEIILQLAEKILIRAGHEVLLFESGEQALEVYRQSSDSIDLVLLDLRLQDMSGYHVLEGMREINPSLSCIFSSGNCPDIEKIPENLKPGTLILEKPYRASALVDIVMQAAAAPQKAVT